MANRLGRFIEAERLRQGIQRGEVARRLGASTQRRMTKLSGGLVMLEREGRAAEDLLADVVRVLGLDAAEVQRLAAEDERERAEEYQRWLEEPVRPVLFERLAACCVRRVQIPDEYAGSSRDVLEGYAADHANRVQRRVCLQLSRRFLSWFAADGTLEARTDVAQGGAGAPHMTLG